VLARLVTDRIIVIGQQQRREIHETFRVGRAEQFAVIPLGLDLRIFAEPHTRRQIFREELGIHENEILVGIVGRLTEIKNHQLFLQAVARYKTQETSDVRVRFVVIGDGNLAPSLRESVARLGLKDDVIFAGSRKDPENFYAGLDIVALTSKNEGTPLTLIEAMANGIPVISTSVGGVVDLLGEEVSEDGQLKICQRGISVRPGDAEAFATGLKRLVDDSNLRKQLGVRGREFVLRNHSRERLLEDVTALYRSVTTGAVSTQDLLQN
jgi:glycosyltransferase involved in cell wall biosynthesis